MSIHRGFRVLWTECTVLASNERCIIHCTGTMSVDAVEVAMNLEEHEIRLPPGFALHAPSLKLQRISVETVKLDAELEYTGANVCDATAHFVGSVWDLKTGFCVARGLGVVPVVDEAPQKSTDQGSKELKWHVYELKVHLSNSGGAAASLVTSLPRGFGRFDKGGLLGPATHTVDFATLKLFVDSWPLYTPSSIRAMLNVARATRGLPPLSDLDLLIRKNRLPQPHLLKDAAGPETLARNLDLELERLADPLEFAEAMESFWLTRGKRIQFRFKATVAAKLPYEDGRCELRGIRVVMSVRFVRVMTPGSWTLHPDHDAAGIACPYNEMVDLAPLATDEDARYLLTGRCPQENGIDLLMSWRRPVLRGTRDCRHVNMLLYGTTVMATYDGVIPVAGFVFC